jgi:tryptophanyl-tRNA synthetase
MTERRRVLTGIKPTGAPHLGNYVGAIRPAIARSRDPAVDSYFFLADYHALIGGTDPVAVQRSTLEIAASWLALGLDPARTWFYRQSDLPEIPELTWLLTCLTSKGQLNRAHAYKAKVDVNLARGEEPDAGVDMGLYMYPVLMAADILIFNAHEVPVGRDQVQHIEIARDLAVRFNLHYGTPESPHFTLPEARVEADTAVLPGLDGRKMSKSYHNTIPLWLSPDDLRKAIAGIVTNALPPGAPKDADSAHLFQIHAAFLDEAGREALRADYAAGIGWGEAKQRCFEAIDAELAPARARYEQLMANPAEVEAILLDGGRRAREAAAPFVARLRRAVGLRPVDQLPAKPPTLGIGAVGFESGAVSGASLTTEPRQSTRARRKQGRTARLVRYERGGVHGFRLLSAEGPVLLDGGGFAEATALEEAIGALLTAQVDGSRLLDADGALLATLSAAGQQADWAAALAEALDAG